jgi:hypothetical protein
MITWGCSLHKYILIINTSILELLKNIFLYFFK